MTELSVTQCPKCETCFNVSEQQLSLAQGVVRCGACLFVFPAAEYFTQVPLDDKPAEPSSESPDVIYAPDLFTAALDSTAAAPNSTDPPVLEEPEAQQNSDETAAIAEGIDRPEDPDQRSPIPGFGGSLAVEADDPSDIVGSLTRGKGAAGLLWGLVSMMLVLSLVLQFLWFNRPVLAQESQWRPYYLMVCAYLSCDLDEFNDPAQLTARELLVRSHLSIDAALSVDVILKNSAIFQQTFPRFRLSFIDKHGAMVASRIFKPEDYLGGELRGLKLIPANTEVRLSLTIVDPGAEAVGYSIDVL